jgi:hypothetical protein
MNVTRLRVLGVFVGLTLALLAAVGIIYASSPNDTSLDGTWVNVNSSTRGIVKLVITHTSNGMKVHAWGACTPTPCDWGTKKGLPYSSDKSSSAGKAFTAVFKDDVARDTVTGVLKANGRLAVNDFEHYVDNSGRYDHLNQDTFKKKP